MLAPSVALACPGCVTSPYGDRTFGWAYLILYAAPFFVASAIAGVLAYSLRSRAGDGRGVARPWPLGRRSRRAPERPARDSRPAPTDGPDKETT